MSPSPHRPPVLERVREQLRTPPGRRRAASKLFAWATIVVVAAGAGAAAAGSTKVGVAVAVAVLLLGIFVADPVLLCVIVLPGSLLLQRLGGSSTNLSAADLLVFIGGVVSLFHIRWKDAGFLKQFLQGILWYQAVLILVVVDHPNRYNIVEWFHRFSYLAFSVLVGWVVANQGRARQAFRLFLAGSALLSVFAMEHSVAMHFQPAQWGAYQKNAIGSILWVAVAVAQLYPAWAGLGKTETRIYKYLCIGGLLASQSRQSWILLIFALVVAVLLNPDARRRSKLILLSAVPLVGVLYYSFSLAARNNPHFNSVSTRFGQIGAALHVYHLSPILGEGMRFYNLPQYITVTAPPNVFVDNLASTGIVGSIAFVYLMWITVRTMFRLPVSLGTLGLVILLGHYVDGLFDTFWIGASTIAPFVIAGISLGMADLARAREDPVSLETTGGDVLFGAFGFPARSHPVLTGPRRVLHGVLAARPRLRARTIPAPG